MYNCFWIGILCPLLLSGSTVVAAPVDGGGKGLIINSDGSFGRARVERSFGEEGGFALRRENGVGLHSEGPELEEAAAVAASSNGTNRARREVKELFQELLSDSKILPVQSSIREKRDEDYMREDGEGVFSPEEGVRFMLDGGLDKMRARRFVEGDKVAGKSEVKGEPENQEIGQDFLMEGEEETKGGGEESNWVREEGDGLKTLTIGEEGKDSEVAVDLIKRDLGSSTASNGLGDDVGGPTAGGSCGGGCNTPECPTFRVYPPFFSTPCCRSTQSCPTKCCPVKPRPVMFITASPPRTCPCPTICCLGEPTCVCQSTCCPTPCSSTCHEHTCPLAGGPVKDKARCSSKLKEESKIHVKEEQKDIGESKAEESVAPVEEKESANVNIEETKEGGDENGEGKGVQLMEERGGDEEEGVEGQESKEREEPRLEGEDEQGPGGEEGAGQDSDLNYDLSKS